MKNIQRLIIVKFENDWQKIHATRNWVRNWEERKTFSCAVKTAFSNTTRKSAKAVGELSLDYTKFQVYMGTLLWILKSNTIKWEENWDPSTISNSIKNHELLEGSLYRQCQFESQQKCSLLMNNRTQIYFLLVLSVSPLADLTVLFWVNCE